MSHSRKNIQSQTLNDCPEPNPDQEIVQVVELRGGPHCLVKTTKGNDVLCLIPTKFRNVIWIKRGNFLIVRKPKLDVKLVKGTKVQAIVDFVLFDDHIKHLKSENLWPEAFANEKNVIDERPDVLMPESEEDENDPFLQSNPNRRQYEESDDEDEEDEEDEE